MDTALIKSQVASPAVQAPAQEKKAPVGALAAYLAVLNVVSAPAHAAALDEKRSSLEAPASNKKLGLGWHTKHEVYTIEKNGKYYHVHVTLRYFTIFGAHVGSTIVSKHLTPASNARAPSQARDQLEHKVLEAKAPVQSAQFFSPDLLALLSNVHI